MQLPQVVSHCSKWISICNILLTHSSRLQHCPNSRQQATRWRCSNEDSNPLIIRRELETSLSVKHQLKVALDQILSAMLNTEHIKLLQSIYSSSFRGRYFTSLFKMSSGKKPPRNLPAAMWQAHDKFQGNVLHPPAPAQHVKCFTYSWSLRSSLLLHLWTPWVENPHSSKTQVLFTSEKAARFQHSFILLTCCVQVKVGRLVGNVSCCLQSWSLCCYFACISLGFVNVHFKRALWDVLSSK